MKVEQKYLLTAILAAAISPSLMSAHEVTPDMAANIPILENTLIDSRIAVSAGDLEAMRDIAMQPFNGNIAMNTNGTPAVLNADKEEIGKEISLTAEAVKPDLSAEAQTLSAETVKPGLSAKVPALSNEGKDDEGNISHVYIKKGLKYTAIATAVALLGGGAIAGGLLLGAPGVAIGVVAGAVVIGVLVSKALHSFWNHF